MILIVGLGNPGSKYAGNRHNVGYMAVDRIASDHAFGPWRARFQGEAAEGRLGETRVTLLKPGTFMNLSGQSVGEAMRYLKLEPAEVIVLHDELDLAPGTVRLKTGGGHAGHNGLRSIHQHIGEAYWRLRIGIGHPGHKAEVVNWVLKKPSPEQSDAIELGIERSLKAVNDLVLGQMDKATVQIHTSKPPRPKPPRKELPAGSPPAATTAATETPAK